MLAFLVITGAYPILKLRSRFCFRDIFSKAVKENSRLWVYWIFTFICLFQRPLIHSCKLHSARAELQELNYRLKISPPPPPPPHTPHLVWLNPGTMTVGREWIVNLSPWSLEDHSLCIFLRACPSEHLIPSCLLSPVSCFVSCLPNLSFKVMSSLDHNLRMVLVIASSIGHLLLLLFFQNIHPDEWLHATLFLCLGRLVYASYFASTQGVIYQSRTRGKLWHWLTGGLGPDVLLCWASSQGLMWPVQPCSSTGSFRKCTSSKHFYFPNIHQVTGCGAQAVPQEAPFASNSWLHYEARGRLYVLMDV